MPEVNFFLFVLKNIVDIQYTLFMYFTNSSVFLVLFFWIRIVRKVLPDFTKFIYKHNIGDIYMYTQQTAPDFDLMNDWSGRYVTER